MAGSEWISAEGEIEFDTVVELEAFLAKEGLSGSFEVRLNSGGGDLSGGLRLGEFFRQHEFSTVAGSTSAPNEYGHHERLPGRCVSAASLAFIGGKHRDANAGEVGVHQFYDYHAFMNPDLKVFGAREMSEHQNLNALLVNYAIQMGVDPRFVAAGSATVPEEMHFFSTQELDDYHIRWMPWEYEPWQLLPRAGGIVARSATRDRSEWAELLAIPSLTLRIEALVALDMEAALSQAGFVVEGIVDTESDAITEAQRLGPDVVLMDIALREGSGIAAAHAIGNSACIIFVSGNSDQRTLEEAGTTPAAAFISKPFTAESLARQVKAACYKHDRE